MYLPPEMTELAKHIAKIRNSDLAHSFGRVAEGMVLRQNLMQERLDTLRLETKHLIFDLEATRQERDELRERFQND